VLVIDGGGRLLMRVVIIGPGRIGCGYLTPLFTSAGHDVVLAAAGETMAKRINRCQRFAVGITTRPTSNGNGRANGNGRGARSFLVNTPRAVSIATPDFVEAVAEADLVCTCVGVSRVRSLAPVLARALAARRRATPLDVWTVENGDCASQLEAGVREFADASGLLLPAVGFAGAVAAVAVARGSWEREVNPQFVGDEFRSLLVDEPRLLTEVPSLPGVNGTRSYRAHLLEKLYVFNAGHAICAYLGALRGHSTIAEAAEDPSLRPIVAGAMLDARRALLAAHPSLGDDLHGPPAEALLRFGDPVLADPIVRVAREPIRKLAPGDRLVGPAELIRRSTGEVSAYFALAVAGALLYRDQDEEQSARLELELARRGVMAVLESVCGLSPAHPFAQAVATRYRAFIITADETIFPPVHVGSPRPTVRRLSEASLARAAGRR
jgi:mannitol-1-phosphate 5-dehydrogenase